ncbi:MAG: GAF domain-containing protein [Chloroflexi bacterium]|nr:GAF domain-containing protein [Chloroflexota bacterium]MBT7290786.1 GAF domain-containing protein [Chloroflexota bacterium]
MIYLQHSDDLKQVIDAMPSYVLLIDEDHCILMANQAVQSQLGLKPDDLIGGYCPKVVHGLDHPFPGCPFEEAVVSGESVEKELYNPDWGSWLMSAVYPTGLKTDYGKRIYLHTVRDITEKKHAIIELEKHDDIQHILNSLLRLSLTDVSLDDILNSAIDLILSVKWLVFESRGSIFLVDDDPDVLVMKAQRGLAEPLLESCARVPFGKCHCGRAAANGRIEYVSAIGDGHEITYEGITPHGHCCIPIMVGNSVLGVLNVYVKEGHQRDEDEMAFLVAVVNAMAGIIQRKQTDKKLANLYDTAKKQLEELQKETAARSNFIKVLAHELRTPLVPIISSAGLLKNMFAQEPARMEYKLSSMLLGGANSLNSRFEELLDLARFAAGDFTFEIAPLDIKELIVRVTSQFDSDAAQKDQTITLNISDNLPKVSADLIRLEQVVTNMMSNAVKLNTDDKSIVVHASMDGESLVVGIQDHGQGVTPEEQARIFEPYHLAEQDRQRFHGIGLGIAISREIVEAHGGRMWLESKQGFGSTFYFSIPVTGKGGDTDE